MSTWGCVDDGRDRDVDTSSLLSSSSSSPEPEAEAGIETESQGGFEDLHFPFARMAWMIITSDGVWRLLISRAIDNAADKLYRLLRNARGGDFPMRAYSFTLLGDRVTEGVAHGWLQRTNEATLFKGACR